MIQRGNNEEEGPYHVMRSVEDNTPTVTAPPESETADSPAATTTLTHRSPVTIADIWEAHKLLKPRLHHTPLAPSRTLHEITHADIYLKAENMQRSGSFKVRGTSGQPCAGRGHRRCSGERPLHDCDARSGSAGQSHGYPGLWSAGRAAWRNL